jgi:hypothetical protein
MKDTIINNTNYSRWAIDELVSESISSDIAPVYEGTTQKVDYADYIHDVEIREDGVYIPEMYKYLPSAERYKPMFYSQKFTKEQYMVMLHDLIQENEPQAFNELQNVNTEKN